MDPNVANSEDANDNFDALDPLNFGINSSNTSIVKNNNSQTYFTSSAIFDPLNALNFEEVKKEQPIFDDFGGLFGDLTSTNVSTNTTAHQPQKQHVQQMSNTTTKRIFRMPFLDLNINNYLVEWLESIRFDVDIWKEQRVYEWIKSLHSNQQLWQQKRYSFGIGNYNVQQVWKHIQDLGLTGRRLQTMTNSSPFVHKPIPPLMFGFQEIMLTQLFIDNRPKDLYIDRDTILVANHEYVFDNIYIKNCTLRINTRGILVLKSLHNIILENGNIDLVPHKSRSCSLPWKSQYKNCIHSGKEYDKVSVGKRGSNGDSCCGGGIGGNGLKLECDKLILCKNSMISLRGTDRIHECFWGCGAGEDGTLLLECNLIKITNDSRIDRRPRIVINSIDMKTCTQMKVCLLYGYMRQCTVHRIVIDDVCNIVDGYLVNKHLAGDRKSCVFGRNQHWVNFVDLETYRKQIEKEKMETKAYKSFYTGIDNNNPSMVVGIKLRQSEPQKVSGSVKELMASAYKKNEQNTKTDNPLDNWFI